MVLQLFVEQRPLMQEKNAQSPLLGLSLCGERPTQDLLNLTPHSAPHPAEAVEVKLA